MHDILLAVIYAENEPRADYAQRWRERQTYLNGETCVYGAHHTGGVPGDIMQSLGVPQYTV